jgi:hypothetical protein
VFRLHAGTEKPLRLYAGQLVEGLILATGLNPIPAQYFSGAIAQSRLIFRNHFGHEITHCAGLSVQRAERRTPLPRLKNALHAPGLRAEQEYQVRESGSAAYGLDSNPSAESNSKREEMPIAASTNLASHSSASRSGEETLSALVRWIKSVVEPQSSSVGTR